jgi:hypothetical protein
MLAVRRAQVGIAEDTNHEVFRSLMKSQHSYALHLQVTFSKFQCNLSYKTLEGGFTNEEIFCFFELISLAATVPGRQRRDFLTAIAFCPADCAAFVAK